MQKLEVTLSDELVRFISKEVDRGHYLNANEVVCAALAALDDVGYGEKLKALRAAIDEGDASGIADGNVFEEIRHRLDGYAEH